MAIIALRQILGRPLTIQEADANFNNINTELGLKVNSSDYTPSAVLDKIKEVDGTNSGLDADLLRGQQATSNNITNSIVSRDSSGNFSAGIISANLLGNVTGNLTGNVTGNVIGSATSISGVLPLTNGGTGATSADSARTSLGLGTISTQSAGNVNITGGSITGISALSITSGGTGATTAVQARTNLGLVIGSDIQPFNSNLAAFSGVTTNGIIVKTATGTATSRSITASTNITITNGDGIAGNIAITGTQTPTVTSIIKAGTSAVGDIGQTSNRFGTIYGTATSAQYADLAEKYTTDKQYESGTVLSVAIAGDFEATQSWESAQRVLGVISTNPAFIMNDGLNGQAVALRGRVPVKVIGPIRKGQPLISTQDGYGTYGDHQNSFAIALETNSDSTVKLVECVIL